MQATIQGVDQTMHEPVTAQSVRCKDSRTARRPWNASPRMMKSVMGEDVGASNFGNVETADVDSLASQYIQQRSGRQRSLMEMVARNAAVMGSL